MNNPLFSIVIPTRNRPKILRMVLMCLKLQKFDDFEVIVCDNYTEFPANLVFDELCGNDKRFRYIHPEKPLPMHDNWEYAIGYAKGTYVAVLGDKACLFPSTLKQVQSIISHTKYDFISWSMDAYSLSADIDDITGKGAVIYPTPIKKKGFEIDIKDLLNKKLNWQYNTRDIYFMGQIYFGFYHIDLINKIRDCLGRVFHLISPDHTSMIAGLSLANKGYYMGRALQLTISADSISNGQLSSISMEHQLQFIQESTQILIEEYSAQLPIKGLYLSIQNTLGRDYLAVLDKIGLKKTLNLSNFLAITLFDLSKINWSNKDTKIEHYKIWNQYYNKESFSSKARIKIRYWSLKIDIWKMKGFVLHLFYVISKFKFGIFRRKQFNNAIDAVIYLDNLR